MKFLLIVTFILIFQENVNTQVVNQFCSNLNVFELPKARGAVNFVQQRLNQQTSQGLAITPEQPAATFWQVSALTDASYNLYRNSEVATELSLAVSRMHFPEGVTQWTDLRGLLRSYTQCVQGFMDSFCVGNRRFSCASNNFRYRSIDGTCNGNLPKRGATETQYVSIVYQHYEDGVQSLRRAIGSRLPLPSARALVNEFFSRCQVPLIRVRNANMGAVMFGQLITHDVSFKPNAQTRAAGPGILCCTKDGRSQLPANRMHPDCAFIPVPSNDRVLRGRGCMNFIRTQTVVSNDCVLTPRLQVNLQTSFLDLSNVYGATNELNRNLRLLQGGLMKLDARRIFARNNDGSYLLPDVRADQTPILGLLHSVFIREHNRIATIIRQRRPMWNDELLFQEARKLVIAEYQHIVMNEWLQVFQGSATNRLRVNRDIDPTTSNEFIHAAFRFLHQISPEIISFYNAAGQVVVQRQLSDVIGNLTELERSYDNTARALFMQNAWSDDCRDQIVNRIFKNAGNIGLDLLSIDIQRGRDHGIAPYHVYVQLCHGITLRSFDDLATLHTQENIQRLRRMYASVIDIDLYVGGSLESDITSTIVGPTFICLTNEQFHHYRTGDLYFYNNPANPNPFNVAQLNQIRQSSWARILCDNTGVQAVPRFAFLPISRNNPLVNCNRIPSVNIL